MPKRGLRGLLDALGRVILPSVESMQRRNHSDAERLLGKGLEFGPLRVRLAQNSADRDEIFKLRYTIFNEELGEGIPENARTRRDTDRFDPFCDHLLIERDGKILGTYRILPNKQAEAAGGFYTETEFHIRSLPINFSEAIEVGRACILKDHRKQSTLLCLFHGLYHYLDLVNAKYLFGMATLAPMSHENALASFQLVQKMGRFTPIPGVEPLEELRIPEATVPGDKPQIPALVSIYFGIGANICAAPAYDPIFRAHDFLTFFNAREMTDRFRNLFDRFATKTRKDIS